MEKSLGSMLWPSLVDHIATSGYSRPYASIARSQDPADGFEDISYARLANAVNRACHWLDSNLSKCMEKSDTFAYLGPNDLRYVILGCAALKTSRKVRSLVFLWLGFQKSLNAAGSVSFHAQHGTSQPGIV